MMGGINVYNNIKLLLPDLFINNAYILSSFLCSNRTWESLKDPSLSIEFGHTLGDLFTPFLYRFTTILIKVIVRI